MNKKSYISIIIIALVLIAIPLIFISEYVKFQTARKDFKFKEKQVEKEKEHSLIFKDAYKKLSEYEEEFEKIESVVSDSDLIIPEFYNFIKKEASYSGIILNNISIGGVSTDTNLGLERTTFSVSFVGSYPVIKNFLSNLYKNVRLISVDSISLKSTGESSFFEFSLTFGIYSRKEGAPEIKADSLEMGEKINF